MPMTAEPEIGEALAIYLGLRCVRWPQPDLDRVRARWGELAAERLAPQLQALVQDLRSLPLDGLPADLGEATEALMRQLRERHPTLSEPGVQALGWLWSFEMR